MEKLERNDKSIKAEGGSQFIFHNYFVVCRMSLRKNPAAICCQQQESRCAPVSEKRAEIDAFYFL